VTEKMKSNNHYNIPNNFSSPKSLSISIHEENDYNYEPISEIKPLKSPNKSENDKIESLKMTIAEL
jgi:hypothetical protein